MPTIDNAKSDRTIANRVLGMVLDVAIGTVICRRSHRISIAKPTEWEKASPTIAFYALRKSRQTFCFTTLLAVTQSPRF